MWFGAGFFSIRRMARRIAPLLISLRGAARKVPNFAQPIILAYETYASAKISRHSVAAWLYGVFIEKLENTYPELSGITDAPIVAFSDASHMGLMKDKMRSCTGSAIFRHSFREEICCSRSLSLITWILLVSLSYRDIL